MAIRETLHAELRTALRAQDRVALAAIRGALSAIANSEAIPVEEAPRAGALETAAIGAGAADAARRELTEEQMRDIVRREADEWGGPHRRLLHALLSR